MLKNVKSSFPPISLTDFYPPVEQIVEQCGKFRLLDRLLSKLFARNHKVHLTVIKFMCEYVCVGVYYLFVADLPTYFIYL